MNKSMIKGIAVGGLAMVALGAGAVTDYKMVAQSRVADVIAVKEIKESVGTPREICENVQVRQQAPVQDPNRIAGTTLGGLAGGLLGNQVGGGSGKTIATIAGAAGGAYAGNRVQKDMQQKDLVATTERRCRTVYDKSQKTVGYQVRYRLDGKDGVVRTSFRPGATLPVRNGKVVTTRRT